MSKKVNTSKMVKATYLDGTELAYANPRKNACGEYVSKAYVNGYHNEDKTVYEDDYDSCLKTVMSNIMRVWGN